MRDEIQIAIDRWENEGGHTAPIAAELQPFSKTAREPAGQISPLRPATYPKESGADPQKRYGSRRGA